MTINYTLSRTFGPDWIVRASDGAITRSDGHAGPSETWKLCPMLAHAAPFGRLRFERFPTVADMLRALVERGERSLRFANGKPRVWTCDYDHGTFRVNMSPALRSVYA